MVLDIRDNTELINDITVTITTLHQVTWVILSMPQRQVCHHASVASPHSCRCPFMLGLTSTLQIV
jgi:hypothetical protein